MRNGSVAMVPLLLAIILFFWFIIFLGGENDNLHSINNIENLQHLQKSLLYSAMKYRYDLQAENPEFTDEELNIKVNEYINNMMKLNHIK